MFELKDTTYSEFYTLAVEKLGLLTSNDLDTYSYSLKQNEPVKAIIYKILVDDIFTEIKKRTAYMARLRSGEASLLDIANMTSDDLQMFDPFIEEIAEEVAERMRTLSRFIVPSFIYREEIDTYYTKDNFSYIIEQREWMTPQALKMIDTRLKETLTTGVMWKWFMYALPTEAEVYMNIYKENLVRLSAVLNSSNPVKRRFIYF